MKKKKKLEQMKVTTDQASQVINVMFSRLNAKDRSRILNMIDCFVLNHLGVPQENVPWFNNKKQKLGDYAHVLDLMRLGYAKLLNQAEKNFIKNLH